MASSQGHNVLRPSCGFDDCGAAPPQLQGLEDRQTPTSGHVKFNSKGNPGLARYHFLGKYALIDRSPKVRRRAQYFVRCTVWVVHYDAAVLDFGHVVRGKPFEA